jgi:hypothetical protein
MTAVPPRFFWSALRARASEGGSSLARSSQRVLRVSCVAAFVGATDVGDRGIGFLDFDLECRNERIFGVYEDVVRFPSQLDADDEW